MLDGQAVIAAVDRSRIYPASTWVLFFRDGSTRIFPAEAGKRIITGTPDGWLSVDDAGVLEHHTINPAGTDLTSTPIAALPGRLVQFLGRSPLGSRISEPTFRFPPREPIQSAG